MKMICESCKREFDETEFQQMIEWSRGKYQYPAEPFEHSQQCPKCYRKNNIFNRIYIRSYCG